MYASDSGFEELNRRRGAEEVALEWLALRMQHYVDLHPESEDDLNGFATWLARADDEDDD